MSLRSSNSIRDTIAVGSTSQRPSGSNGLIRHNTSYGDGGRPEFYVNGSWIRLDESPTPGNGNLGISGSTSNGCSVSGTAGKANQTTASTQTLSLHRPTLESWYKDPDPAYKAPPGGSFFLDGNNTGGAIVSNFISSITRSTGAAGKFQVNYSTSRRFVLNGQTNSSTFRPEDRGKGNDLPVVASRNSIPFANRDWNIDFVNTSYISGMSFIY